jgi:hypothetical protein
MRFRPGGHGPYFDHLDSEKMAACFLIVPCCSQYNWVIEHYKKAIFLNNHDVVDAGSAPERTRIDSKRFLRALGEIIPISAKIGTKSVSREATFL